jgi:hypothetical protein
MPDDCRRRFAALVVVILLTIAAPFAATRAQDMSQFPDWSGQWRRPAGLAVAWDPTKPPGLGQEAPLTPEYQAIFEAILKDRADGGLTGDPTGLCLPHGMPRMMIGIFPVEFVITPKITYYLTDYTTPRRIFTDSRDWPKDLAPSFNGYSIGRWVDTDGDGRYDVLEVETRGFKSPRTFEGSGLPLHRDGESVITERIFGDKADANLLHDEITVIDHALTRPWTVTRHYQREPAGEWDFVDCAENNPHVVIGNETYMLSAEGLLMPTKAGQRPPDLRYFKEGKSPAATIQK